MGCSTCSTTDSTNGTPAGCKSNGTCGTGGCNKLNVYNWLSDMVLPEGHKPFDVLEIRFKGSRKEFFRNVNNLELKVGDIVAVEGNPGHDIGEVSMVGELVRFQLRKKNLSDTAVEIKTLYRVAKQADIDKWNEVKGLEFNTMHRSRTIALQLGLKMKLSDVEYQGDGKKATFFYTADERVDFRELIKKLADEFKVRIEMRQIGMRQEAARLGGIGSCGRELCCSTWLTDFKIVSTSAARYQNLSLNPLKLAGQCGKLKCCLNYELDTYMDALRDIPESNIRLSLSKGTMVHRKTDIFKRVMWYNLIPEVKDSEERTPFVPENWVPLSVERVKEIIDLNKRGQKPDDAGMLEMEDTTEDDMHYKDVVGQDSLTRMDRKKKKKKKKPTGKEGGEKAPVANTPAAKQAAPQQSRPAPQQPKPASAPVQKAPTSPAQPSGNRPPRQAPEAPKPNQGTGNASARPERKVPGTPENNTSAPTSPAPVTPAPTAPTNNPATNSTTPTKSNRPPRKFDRGS
jgi:cell fate regulator YaaT (PSP1 superfamily)